MGGTYQGRTTRRGAFKTCYVQGSSPSQAAYSHCTLGYAAGDQSTLSLDPSISRWYIGPVGCSPSVLPDPVRARAIRIDDVAALLILRLPRVKRIVRRYTSSVRPAYSSRASIGGLYASDDLRRARRQVCRSYHLRSLHSSATSPHTASCGGKAGHIPLPR